MNLAPQRRYSRLKAREGHVARAENDLFCINARFGDVCLSGTAMRGCCATSVPLVSHCSAARFRSAN